MARLSEHFSFPGKLGFGGAPLGNMYAPVDEETATATLRAAWDSRVRYFDTAPHYGRGLSEHRFGHVLRDHRRDDYVLSTKVGRLMQPDPKADADEQFIGALSFTPRYDYTADGARRSIEDSLQRLGLPRIDIVYIHDVSEDIHGPAWREMLDTALNGAARALTELKQEGVIGAWGLGVNLVEPCEIALERSEPDVFLLAGRYSLLDLSGLDGLFPKCRERGVEIVIGGPYNSGLLAGGDTFDYAEAPPDKVKARDRIAALCQEYGVDIRAAALQFCAAHPVVAAVIPGGKRPDRPRENAELMRQPIPAALWDRLKREGILPETAPTPEGA